MINLRRDDVETLAMIRDFWGVGTISLTKRKPPIHDCCCFQVHRVNDLVKVVIPHFEKYPLLAKKRRDFEVWKKAVLLCYEVKNSPVKSRGYRKGHFPRWNPEIIDSFWKIIQELQEVRQYVELPIPEPANIRTSTGPLLF